MQFKQDIVKTMGLAWPVILGQLAAIALGVVDNVMVGKLGAGTLAASALANNILVLPLVLGFGVSFALSPLVASARGAYDIQMISKLLVSSLYVCASLGMFGGVFLWYLAQNLHWFNNDLALIKQASSYLTIIGWSLVPLFLYQALKQFLEGLEIMQPPLWVGILSIPLNIMANWIFIYGNWGVPAYGLNGAGYGTLITRILMVIGLLVYIGMHHKHASTRQYLWQSTFKTTKEATIKLLKLGIPSGFQFLFEAGAFVFAAILVGLIDTKQLAAHQIALNVASITFMVAMGISAAGSIRVGHALGKGNKADVRVIGGNAFLLGGGFMAFAGIFLVFANRIIPTWYLQDIEVVNYAAKYLLIAAIFQVSDGIQAVGNGLLRGMGDVKVPTLWVLFAYWVVGLPIGAWLAFYLRWGALGIWVGLAVGLSICAATISFRFWRLSSQK